MENGKKITVQLSPVVLQKLDQICKEKGIRRPAAMSIAIDKLWKEDHAAE